MDGGCCVDATSCRLRAALASVRANRGVPRPRAHGARHGEATALRQRALVVRTAAEGLLGARGQGEALALVQRDYQNTGSEGRGRRGSLRGRCGQLAVSRGREGMQRRGGDAPMPLGSPMAALLLAGLVEALGVCWSTMVDVDEERLNVLASGARCVSLSSAECVRTRTHNRRAAGLRTLGELPRHGGSGSAVVIGGNVVQSERPARCRCRCRCGWRRRGPRGAGAA